MTVNNRLLNALGLTPNHIIIVDKPSAKRWLSALAASPLQYHLDDHIVDVFEGDVNALQYLESTVDLCRELLGDDAAWEHYFDECQAAN
jgi:hypothetical protein